MTPPTHIMIHDTGLHPGSVHRLVLDVIEAQNIHLILLDSKCKICTPIISLNEAGLCQTTTVC